MRIHILYEFKDGPWGGGNQFLKALRTEFIARNVYEEDIYEADVVLFNSYPFGNLEYFNLINKLKKIKGILVFHRLDGPISVVRGQNLEIDHITFLFNNLYSDATIFQSVWVKKESEKLGLEINPNHTIIINAPDKNIFFKENISYDPEEKLRIIATSWSGNMRKGFDVYEWLDKNLDFTKYKFTFIGNSPIRFQNILHLQPLLSHELAIKLKENHVYITASKHEPCSNALLEAMHCGLPAIAYNNGGNAEIVGKGGELFTENEEIIEKLELIKNNYFEYVKRINLPDMTFVANEYLKFMKELYEKDKSNL